MRRLKILTTLPLLTLAMPALLQAQVQGWEEAAKPLPPATVVPVDDRSQTEATRPAETPAVAVARGAPSYPPPSELTTRDERPWSFTFGLGFPQGLSFQLCRQLNDLVAVGVGVGGLPEYPTGQVHGRFHFVRFQGSSLFAQGSLHVTRYGAGPAFELGAERRRPTGNTVRFSGGFVSLDGEAFPALQIGWGYAF